MSRPRPRTPFGVPFLAFRLHSSSHVPESSPSTASSANALLALAPHARWRISLSRPGDRLCLEVRSQPAGPNARCAGRASSSTSTSSVPAHCKQTLTPAAVQRPRPKYGFRDRPMAQVNVGSLVLER